MWNQTFLQIAPAEGLLLNRVSFKYYNVRDYIPDKINSFNEKEEADMLAFKRDVIYKHIVDVEKKDRP